MTDSDRTRRDHAQFEPAIALQILRKMHLIRSFEERAADLVRSGILQCPVHLCIGQEAISAGVCQNLGHSDSAFSTHRSHGHYLAKGGNVNALMAELYGKSTGASRGFGGSMHVSDTAVGFMGSSAIVSGTVPLAVGAALNAMLRCSQDIGVAFFGDGATDEGVFYESLNFAVLRKLPVLFICENNSFSTHMPDFLRQSNPCVHERVAGFGIRSRRVDGNDAMEVYRAAREFVEQARSGEGPGLLECMTFRWLAHVGSDEDVDIGYRRKELIDLWKQRCPINALEGELSRRGVLTGEQLRANRKEASTIVDAAIQFAESGAYPTQDLIGSGL
jgi:TPP-dependent pyruvate/acetoin dehydrogenase alpha subunit